MILSLPYPPTGNHSAKHTRNGGHFLTPQAKTYRAMVNAHVLAENAAKGFSSPMAVICEVFHPDRRRRDLDNVWKTLADALTKANVWKDDSQIVDLRLVRRETEPGGRVVVSIEEVEEVNP
jgi:crossover junction endodeoxyribonuclease RusA